MIITYINGLYGVHIGMLENKMEATRPAKVQDAVDKHELHLQSLQWLLHRKEEPSLLVL